MGGRFTATRERTRLFSTENVKEIALPLSGGMSNETHHVDRIFDLKGLNVRERWRHNGLHGWLDVESACFYDIDTPYITCFGSRERRQSTFYAAITRSDDSLRLYT